MCTRIKLQNYVIILVLMKAIQMIYIFAFGLIIALDIHLHQAYGFYIKQIGIGLIIIAVIGSMNMFIGVNGSRCHNKFLLMMYLIFDSTMFLVQTILGQRLVRAATPIFDSNFRYDCARHAPTLHNNDGKDSCKEYLHHDRTSGFKLVWTSYKTRAAEDASYYKRIMDIQMEESCCGFGPPKRCIPDSSPFHEQYSKLGIPLELVTEKQVCAEEEFWYPPTDTCNNDQTNLNPLAENNSTSLVAGCMYDRALGKCQNDSVEVSSAGCLAALEDKINASLEPPSRALLGLSSIQALAFVTSCCLCWKRKREDALPNMENFKNIEKRW